MSSEAGKAGLFSGKNKWLLIIFQWHVGKCPRHIAPFPTKPLNYKEVGNLLLQVMLKGKNMVIWLLKGKISLNLNLLKPSPTLKLVMIISEHCKILSQNDSSKAETIWLLTFVMSECSLRFIDDLGDILCAMYPGVECIKQDCLRSYDRGIGWWQENCPSLGEVA